MDFEELGQEFLPVIGEIPAWLSGTMVRNGPVTVSVEGKTNRHWFDGLAMLHAFSFDGGRVSYANKFLRTEAYRAVFDKKSLNYEGFATDPCRSIFKLFFNMFLPYPLHNANVNVAKFADAYVAMTEIPLPVEFDLKTLNTLGVFEYQDRLPKSNCWESAHPHKSLNYLIKFGRTSYYTFYHIEGKERKVIAQIPAQQPAYMHSFAVTENYLVLTEFPLVVNPLDLLRNRPFIKNYTWHPERGTQFIVVNRHSGALVGRYQTRPFFAFHHANAFEEGDLIHLDMVTYEDASIITQEALNVGVKGAHHPSQLERFSLSLKSGEISSEILFSVPNEFPRINGAFDGLPYRYLYLTGFSPDRSELLCSDSLYKVDTRSKEVLRWAEDGCSPGEPLFVAHGDAEDEGVILTIVLDEKHQSSFLLVLDGKTFKELGRASAPHLIPIGLHGQFFVDGKGSRHKNDETI